MTGDEENRCKFEFIEEPCHRKRESGSEFCICHLKEAGKDPEKFWDEVDRVLGDVEAKEFNFAGFFFIPRGEENKIDFRSITFSKPAKFNNATFSEEAYFWKAKFSKDADFSATTFSKDAKFANATFSEEAYFWGAKFFKYTEFSETTFFGWASFTGATFFGWANFVMTKFSKNADFDMVTISKEVFFTGNTFSGVANFERATFSKNAYFSDTTFSKDALFEHVTFKGKARFQESKFKASSSFEGAEFNELYFKNASFDDDLDFSEVSIESYAKFTKTKFRSEVNFRECDFEKPERISFNGVDLGKTSFKNTDLSRVHFVNCEWAEVYRRPEALQKIVGKGRPRRGIYDEILLKKKPDDIKYSDVETLYRQLKYNYEEKRNYPDAGDFYIGEMEMRRKRGSPLLPLYKILSMYGESYWLPPVWIFSVVIVFGAIFLLLGFEYNGTTIDYSLALNIPSSVSTLHDFLLSYIYVFKAITLQSVSISPVKGSIVSEFVQAILKPVGVVLFTLWALALRRRFRR